jgi:hypothetical protein
MDRDFKSAKYKYFINFYLKVLEVKVGLIFDNLNKRYMFMQDNAFIYITYKVRD